MPAAVAASLVHPVGAASSEAVGKKTSTRRSNRLASPGARTRYPSTALSTPPRRAPRRRSPTGAGPRLVALSPLGRSQERHDAGKRDSDQAPGGAEEDVLRRAALARFQGRVEQPIAGVLA